MNIGTIIYTWLKGHYVGIDNDGNKYYSNSKNFKSTDAKIWVIFRGEVEAVGRIASIVGGKAKIIISGGCEALSM